MTIPSPRLSLVIPTYRRCASVRRLLESLTSQTLPRSEFEVIVSIDGSEDGTHEMVETFATRLPVRAIWQPNRGRAAACNAGIAASRGEVLVILDDDMEPDPECLATHLALHAQAARRAVLGAVPVTFDDKSPPPASYIRAKFERHDAKLAQPGYRITHRDFYSGNLSIRRALLDEVGRFDESFQVYGNEDGELGLRLSAAGVDLVYSREAKAAQHYEKDFAALANDSMAKAKTAILSVRMHPETLGSSRLAYYYSGSRKWLVVRTALLGFSRVVRQTPAVVIWAVNRLEVRGSPRLHRYYRLALDYFFWLGAGPNLGEWKRR
jgi:GT2 family glycosyltransferase